MGQGAEKGGGQGRDLGEDGREGTGTPEWQVLEDGRALPRPYLEGVPNFQDPADSASLPPGPAI